MKILQTAVFGAFLIISQPVLAMEASEPDTFTDIADIFEISLGSGDIFTIPAFLPGIIQYGEATEGFQANEEENLPEKGLLLGAVKKEKETENKKIVVDPKEKIKKWNAPQKPTAASSVQKQQIVVVTAYSSTADQTDSSPCITANGFNVCQNNRENIIAANFLPFNTRVRLPDIYDERVFTVQDRMHRRYSNSRVDIWMKTRAKAKHFGVKRSKIEIVSEQIALQQ